MARPRSKAIVIPVMSGNQVVSREKLFTLLWKLGLDSVVDDRADRVLSMLGFPVVGRHGRRR